jgi:hypothetical protein
MARFEVERDGRRFEVDAPDRETALRAVGINRRAPESFGEYAGGLARQAAQGLTFGFADEAEALARSVGGSDYGETLEQIRRENERFSERHPLVSTAANIVGGVPTLAFGPGAAAARWAQAARTLPTGERVAGTIGQQIRRSTALGSGVGAAYGLGSGEGGPGEQGNFADRIPTALTGAAFGGALGAATPPVANAISAGIRNLRSAPASGDPHYRVAAGMGDETLDDLANAAAFGTTNERVNRRTLDILGREMVRANGDRVTAAQETIRRIQAEHGVSRATAESNLRQLLRVHRDSDLMLGEYPAVSGSDRATRNMQAANVTDDMAGASREVGTQDLIDYVANSGTMASAQNVRNAIGNRAETLGDRTREIVGRLSPGQRTIEDVEDMLANVRRSGQADYDAVYRAPNGLGPDGQPVINQGRLFSGLNAAVQRALGRMRNMGGDQLDAMRQALDRFYIAPHQGVAGRVAAEQNVLAPRLGVPLLEEQLRQARRAFSEASINRAPRATLDEMRRDILDLSERLTLARREATVPNERALTTSLEAAQNARSAIRGQIEAVRRAGRTDIAGILQPLYDDITRVMERASPLWARANHRWAEMRLEEAATELGDAFSKRAGPRYREQLRQFRRLAPEAQDIVRVHFVQQMLDQIENAVRLGSQQNLGRLFSTGHTRDAIRTILGDDAAVEVARMIRDANVMARSQGMLRGSQTHRRGQVQQEQDADINTVVAATNFDWGNWRQAAFQRLREVWRERRNRAMGRTLATPMRDMPAVSEQIELMRRAAERVRQANAPRLPPASLRGALPFVGPLAPTGNR